MGKLRIDPSIGLAFALPSIRVNDGVLHLGWPVRHHRVIVEPKGRERRPRPRTAALVDRPDRASTKLRPDIAALLAFDGDTPTDVRRTLETAPLSVPSGGVLKGLRGDALRALLSLDAGVAARCSLGGSALCVLRAQLHLDLGDLDSALCELDSNDTVSTIRRCSILAAHSRHDEVIGSTDGVVSIDPTTTYLAVMRGVAAGHVGDDATAVASFSEALRLARTDDFLIVRALLERARLRTMRRQYGRAKADVRRARELKPTIDGVDRALRSLAQL